MFNGWAPDACWRMTGSDMVMWHTAAERRIAEAAKRRS